MARRLVFDIETNGFLREVTKLHCLVIKDLDTGERWSCGHGHVSLDYGIELLRRADVLIGHNIIKYDIPVLNKLYPWAKLDPAKAFDTQTMARVIYADIGDTVDAGLLKKGRLLGKYFGKHSLEAWGHRLGILKGEYTDWCEQQGIENPWAEWRQEMQSYCEQDVEVTEALFRKLESKAYPQQCLDLEHRVQVILARQERRGFCFDKEAAIALHGKLLAEKLRLEKELRLVFKPRYLRDGKEFIPKRTAGVYTIGVPVQKVKLTEFNPGSRDHIATWLQRGFGWAPMEFTKDGKPKCDETTLNDLPWPEAKVLVQYLTVAKRLGQLYEGEESWFRHEYHGRIHGGVNTNGAVTGRMTHAGPNMGQVPACSALYGAECRALFTAAPGMVLVGIDADALELRDLAGYMAKFDGGAYIKTVLEGKKEDGTDMHSVNCRALGMQPKEKQWDGRPGREVAKTWFYAFIYGAGDEKLGFIRSGQKGPEAVAAGKKARKSFLTGLPALGKLVEQVKKVSKERGYLLGLDGRRLNVRGQHSALNTLLQSAGAVQMKVALTMLDEDLQAAGLVPGVDYEFVANVHDEWQIECKPELGEQIGQMGKEAIRKAGESLGFRCPLDGAYAVGRTWADTH